MSKPTLLSTVVRANPERSSEEEDEQDEELSSISSDADPDIDEELAYPNEPVPTDTGDTDAFDQNANLQEAEGARKKRKREPQDDDLEDRYMAKLAKSETKGLTQTQEEHQKRQKNSIDNESSDELVSAEDMEEVARVMASPPPRHETLSSDQPDLEKAARTVFLANVSTEAITAKGARKKLLSHLASHLEALSTTTQPHKVESLRFRSTAFASALPKRAAFTKKELMDATTKATNAYAVYSTKEAAQEAARKLNGTVVLGRHLRVDQVAHPSKTDHKRCVFVGNLGFVDDESSMQANMADQGEKKKSKQKEPSDVEEGLWRQFSKVGKVESVRVVRDAKTRVGKGFAYVQFTDENAVEAALLFNEQKFPPMLPRKLRVVRAKAPRRNTSIRGGLPSKTHANGVYVPKISSQQHTMQGRANKLLGKAGAAQMKSKSGTGYNRPTPGEGIKPPESFVFEGHRATNRQRPKLKTKKGKGGKPQTRSSKRGAAWKSSGGKK